MVRWLVQELEINMSRAESHCRDDVKDLKTKKKLCEEPNNKIIETLLTRCVAMSAFLFFGSPSLSFLSPF